VIETWLVRPQSASVKSRLVLKLAGHGIDTVCADAEGACSEGPYDVTEEVPPPDESAGGFLQTVDLPVLPGIKPPWQATGVDVVSRNPSATDCDSADFTGEGATRVTARTYVVPGSKRLPSVFGMSETIGTFRDGKAARQFVNAVYRNVRKCGDRQLNLALKREAAFDAGRASGRVWQIESAASENTSFVFRVALVRVGETVAEVTFTPSGTYDVDQAEYVRLAQRAGERIAQAQSG
jgi:hypothetical protein